MRARLRSILQRFRGGLAPVRKVGLAWYSESQWSLLREVSSDAGDLELTHAEWLPVAQARYDELTKKGVTIVKVPVDVADMARWCHEMGRPVNSESRALYAAFRLETPKDAKLPFSH